MSNNELDPGTIVSASIEASSSCRCLSNPIEALEKDGAFEGCHNIRFTQVPFAPQQKDADACVSTSFGNECGHWWGEVYSREDCAGQDWCNEQWCFVDPLNCDYPTIPANIEGAAGLHISYNTCGSLGTYKQSFHHVLDGSTIRVKYLDGTSDELKDYIDKIFFQQFNFKIEQKDISAPSLQRYPTNTKLACAHDVALSKIDLCIGDDYYTSEQLLFLSSLTSPLYTKQFHFVPLHESLDSTQDSFWEQTLTIFKPFTWQLWSVIAGVLVAWILAFRAVSRRQHSNLKWYLLIGFFVFLTSVTAVYAANLTSVLRDNSMTSQSIQAVGNGRVCVPESLILPTMDKYSFLSETQLIATRQERSIPEGRCVAAITSCGQQERSAAAEGQEPFLEADVTLPVSANFANAFNYQIHRNAFTAYLKTPSATASSACPPDFFATKEQNALTIPELTIPIAFLVLLVLWVLSAQAYHLRLRRTRKVRDRLGIAFWDASDDWQLKHELQSLSATEIVNALRAEAKVSNQKLVQAMSDLPCKRRLVRLLFEQRSYDSVYKRSLAKLHSLDILQLFAMASKQNRSKAESALEGDDPKPALVSLVMKQKYQNHDPGFHDHTFGEFAHLDHESADEEYDTSAESPATGETLPIVASPPNPKESGSWKKWGKQNSSSFSSNTRKKKKKHPRPILKNNSGLPPVQEDGLFRPPSPQQVQISMDDPVVYC